MDGWIDGSVNARASLVAQMGKNLPATCETWIQSLDWEDPLEGMATHSSMLAWRIPMNRGVYRVTVHVITKSRRQGLLGATRHIQPECLPYLQIYGILVTMQKKTFLKLLKSYTASSKCVGFFSYQVLIFSNK